MQRFRRLSLLLPVLLGVLFLSGASAESAEGQIGVLRGLDKVTARVSEISAPLGVAVAFGSLKIVVRRCRKSRPVDLPEVTAYLEIDDMRLKGQEPLRVFAGWVFASSPSVSTLEHPVYDIWLIDCKTASADKSSSARKK